MGGQYHTSVSLRGGILWSLHITSRVYIYALSDCKRDRNQRVLFEPHSKHQNISLLTDWWRQSKHHSWLSHMCVLPSTSGPSAAHVPSLCARQIPPVTFAA